MAIDQKDQPPHLAESSQTPMSLLQVMRETPDLTDQVRDLLSKAAALPLQEHIFEILSVLPVPTNPEDASKQFPATELAKILHHLSGVYPDSIAERPNKGIMNDASSFFESLGNSGSRFGVLSVGDVHIGFSTFNKDGLTLQRKLQRDPSIKDMLDDPNRVVCNLKVISSPSK